MDTKELQKIADVGFEIEYYCMLDKKIKRGLITKVEDTKDGKLLTVTNFSYRFYLKDDVKFTGKVIISVEKYKDLLDQIERNFCWKCHNEGLKEAFGGY